MKQRMKGKIAIFRDHPDLETARNLVYLRPLGSKRLVSEIACVYAASAGTEREANAKFIVKAWNSHDLLVKALRAAEKLHRIGLVNAAEGQIERVNELRRAALAAAEA